MERSYSHEVDSYDYLAKYYDELLQDEESLQYWLDYIESKPFKTVLELASGSGVMAKILKNKGYDIIASDLSESMKEAAKYNYDGDYRIINMSNFKLDNQFDLILCLCDSINYLTEKELSTCFKCVYEHLNKNGRFIFDMHALDRLKEFKEEYVEEGELTDGTQYIWTINSNEEDMTLSEHFTFFKKDDTIQEHHSQTVFTIEMIENKLNEIGFNVEIIKDFIPEEKVLIIGEKR